MPGAWIAKRPTKDGQRFRVMYRLWGRETAPRYGGSFKTKTEAEAPTLTGEALDEYSAENARTLFVKRVTVWQR